MRNSDVDEMTKVFIVGFCAVIGCVIGAIAAPPSGPMLPLLTLAFMLGAGGVAYVTLLFVKPKAKATATPASSTPATRTAEAPPLSPELTSQIQDIVNSGREPALIVEEVRRLTEARP